MSDEKLNAASAHELAIMRARREKTIRESMLAITPQGKVVPIDPDDMATREAVDQPMTRHHNQEFGPVERVPLEERAEKHLPPFEIRAIPVPPKDVRRG